MKKYNKTAFIFRRDLRLPDNTGLNQALSQSQAVIPCFNFDPRQIEPHPYQSQPALAFMLQSLDDLREQLKNHSADLALFFGSPTEMISQLVEHCSIESIFVNRDYTPFSRERDKEIAQACKNYEISFNSFGDALLFEPEQVLKQDQTPYKVFTAFYNRAKLTDVPTPETMTNGRFFMPDKQLGIDTYPVNAQFNNEDFPGGRKQALKRISQLDDHKNYAEERDFPALDGITKLSPHFKFGTCSIREAYYGIVEHLSSEHPLLRQLYWRDFFTHIGFHFPDVFGHAFLEKFERLEWNDNKTLFKAWCEGMTGFPIVDAGMRELNSTGFMHNRVRMITASFLVKDLHIDWRWGERYFAQHLVDYDPCVNNGNWQWAASTGCDAQPYFRIFNPWTQQQKFDPECKYIFKWIPELKDYDCSIVHNWNKKHQDGKYPEPLIDHAIESREAKSRYQQAADNK